MGNYFNKGFNLIYHPKVHCPMCKEEIYANALKCPNCKTNFEQTPYINRTYWQRGAMKIVLIFSSIVGLSIYLNEGPIFLGVFIALAVYGFGYVVIQKIQSFKNYHHK